MNEANARRDEDIERIPEGLIDLKELFGVVWSRRSFVLLSTLIGIIISVLYALSLPDVYRAEALLAPNHESGSRLTQLARQYSGIANIAGLNLSTGFDAADETTLSLEMMRSRTFFAEYLYDKILVELTAATEWDETGNELVIDSSVYDEETHTWMGHDSGETFKPTVQKAHGMFSNRLGIEETQNGLIMVSIEHASPYVAKKWVDLIINSVNSAVRLYEINNAKRSIDYLVEQQESTSVISLLQAFSRLIEEQTKTMILANVTDQFAFRVIDPAVAPEQKIRPMRSRIFLIGTLLAFMASIAVVLTRHYFFSGE